MPTAARAHSYARAHTHTAAVQVSAINLRPTVSDRSAGIVIVIVIFILQQREIYTNIISIA